MITVQTRLEGRARLFTLSGQEADPGLLASVLDGIAVVLDDGDRAVVDLTPLTLTDRVGAAPVFAGIAHRLGGTRIRLVCASAQLRDDWRRQYGLPVFPTVAAALQDAPRERLAATRN